MPLKFIGNDGLEWLVCFDEAVAAAKAMTASEPLHKYITV